MDSESPRVGCRPVVTVRGVGWTILMPGIKSSKNRPGLVFVIALPLPARQARLHHQALSAKWPPCQWQNGQHQDQARHIRAPTGWARALAASKPIRFAAHVMQNASAIATTRRHWARALVLYCTILFFHSCQKPFAAPGLLRRKHSSQMTMRIGKILCQGRLYQEPRPYPRVASRMMSSTRSCSGVECQAPPAAIPLAVATSGMSDS